MGNYVSFQSPEAIGKIVLSDGTVHLFEGPLTAAELMLEHPNQVVVELRSAVAGKRPSPLTADEKLVAKKVYVMLPARRGRPVALSSEEARRALLRADWVLTRRQDFLSAKFLPVLARTCSAGVVQKKEALLLERHVPEGRHVQDFQVPEGFGERPEYLSRQLSGRGWKPSLDTIKEKRVERKVSHWLF
ncbi:uncharacterized protein LOC131156759 [Malania oleifera]|uniref:uncharacterized protein LOC131156759 n=1 Tax=Malania oleifera TaxID=397392 RepID=UPI0025AE491A|nr:uncharacterized protein LOC131156759 [Malania oleifera]